MENSKRALKAEKVTARFEQTFLTRIGIFLKRDTAKRASKPDKAIKILQRPPSVENIRAKVYRLSRTPM